MKAISITTQSSAPAHLTGHVARHASRCAACAVAVGAAVLLSLSIGCAPPGAGKRATGGAHQTVRPFDLPTDSSLRWQIANPTLIQTDAGNDAWNAGHVNDMLKLDDGSILVASDSGGIWSILPNGTTLSLADGINSPNIISLTFGPDGPRHIYAAPWDDPVIYETDTSQPAPLFSWTPIALPDNVGGGINKILALPELRKLVIANANGVWWSDIPPTPSAHGSYNWQLAQGIQPPGTGSRKFGSLAAGPLIAQWMKPFRITDPKIVPRGGAVASVARTPNHLDVFWADDNGEVGTTWWDAAPGDNWNQHSPFRISDPNVVPPGAPVAAVARNPNHLDVFWVDNNGEVGTNWWDAAPGNDWNQHSPFRICNPGSLPAGGGVAAVARNPNHLDVFWIGNDGAIWTNWWDAAPGDNWNQHSPFAITGTRLGRPGGAVSVVARTATHLDVFWVGTDGAVWTQWWDAAAGDNWNQHSAFAVTNTRIAPPGAPVAAVARTSTHLDLFWADNSGEVGTTWWDAAPGDNWNQHSPFRITDPNIVPAGAYVSAVSRNPNHLDVFWADLQGEVGTQWWDAGPNGNWNQHPAFRISDPNIVPPGAGVASVARTPDHLDVFWCDDAGEVGTNWWDAHNSNAIVAAAWGTSPSQKEYAFYYGDWTSGALVMQPGSVFNADESAMQRISIASSANYRNVVYAVAAGAGPSQDQILAIMRSDDGGRNWNPVPTLFDGGNNGWYNNAIAVSPHDPNRVAIGWRSGPFISIDAGGSWSQAPTNPHVHGDVHAVYFDPSDTSSNTVFTGSDGGITMTPDLGKTYVSTFNEYLQNLQIYQNSIAISPTTDGLVVFGTQDNDNLYSVVGSTPYRVLGGCDGGRNLFLSTGQLVRYHTGCDGAPILLATWNGTSFDDHGTIPVRNPGSPPDPNGLTQPPNVTLPIENVREPRYTNAAGQKMLALAGHVKDLFGLFGNADGSDLHWEQILSVPIADGQTISAVGSVNGKSVYVGTTDTRFFAAAPNSSPLEMVLPGSASGAINRLDVQSDALIFVATSNGALLSGVGFTYTAVNLPTTGYVSVASDPTTSPPRLFAISDTTVFESVDSGQSWLVASTGLPFRPHNADLRFNRQSDGSKFLYLGTSGRSLYRARLP